jgi:hypothetical protein
MRFRTLRIAWSVFWGLACVLLIVLWIRSYRISDSVYHRTWLTSSMSGAIGIVRLGPASKAPWPARWTWGTLSRDEFQIIKSPWHFHSDKFETEVVFPHWIPVLLAGTLTAIPWLCYRFSLRTLLIATTLVAVVLGLAVWAVRK